MPNHVTNQILLTGDSMTFGAFICDQSPEESEVMKLC